jgi:aspartate/methionine/tyrosine aminotransferase
MIEGSGAVSRLGASQRGLADNLPKPRVAKIVKLSSGDPSFDTPAYIVDAANRAMKEGYTHYPPPPGDPELREAIAAYQSRLSGVPIAPSEILVTAGATGAISASMIAFLNAGDEVILLDPTYSLYADVARTVGANPVFVPLTAAFEVDVRAVRRAVTDRTRMLVLNYPSNPTGQLLKQQELDGLADIAGQHNLAVLADEAYDQLVFEGRHRSVLGHPGMTERTLVANTFSKTYAMTGWRLGWVAAKGELIKPVLAVNRSILGAPSYISQRAGLVALTDEAQDRVWREWMLGQYRIQRQAMLDALARLPGVHVCDAEAAFYVWVRYGARLSSLEMMKYLYERGLLIRPGTEFGSRGEGYIRFTFAPSVRVIGEGMEIFARAIADLNAS